ncbi:MAG: hypothetical protein WC362_06990 [Methanoregula sp.]|jgi:hypothetical protein
MINHAEDTPLDELTMSPAVYSGAIVVAVVTGVVAAVEPELLEQPIMVTDKTRKIPKTIKITAEFFIYICYSAGY